MFYMLLMLLLSCSTPKGETSPTENDKKLNLALPKSRDIDKNTPPQTKPTPDPKANVINTNTSSRDTKAEKAKLEQATEKQKQTQEESIVATKAAKDAKDLAEANDLEARQLAAQAELAKAAAQAQNATEEQRLAAEKAKEDAELAAKIAEDAKQAALAAQIEADARARAEQEAAEQLAREQAIAEQRKLEGERQVAFIDAVYKGYAEKVAELISAGVNVNVTYQEDGATPLMKFAYMGNKDVVAQLIAAKADVNATDNRGETALMNAAINSNTEIIAHSLNKDNIDDVTMENEKKDRAEIVTQLIDAKANIHITDNYGNTALMHAANMGCEYAVAKLKAAGIDINAKDIDGKNALMLAVSKGYRDVIILLTSYEGIDIRATDNLGNTLLMLAVQSGNKDTTTQLLAIGEIDVNAKNNAGQTALMIAVQNGHAEIVAPLIAAKADVNTQDKNGKTALILAIEQVEKDIIAQLIKAKANLYINDDTSEDTPLKIATKLGNKDIIETINNAIKEQKQQLISVIKGTDEKLDQAALQERINLVAQLIASGTIDVNTQDEGGYTALIWASFSGFQNFVTQLIAAGADVNSQNKDGWTALMWAVLHSKDKEIVDQLIAAGADVTIKNNCGHNALDLAKTEKLDDIAKAIETAQPKSANTQQ